KTRRVKNPAVRKKEAPPPATVSDARLTHKDGFWYSRARVPGTTVTSFDVLRMASFDPTPHTTLRAITASGRQTERTKFQPPTGRIRGSDQWSRFDFGSLRGSGIESCSASGEWIS